MVTTVKIDEKKSWFNTVSTGQQGALSCPTLLLSRRRERQTDRQTRALPVDTPLPPEQEAVNSTDFLLQQPFQLPRFPLSSV